MPVMLQSFALSLVDHVSAGVVQSQLRSPGDPATRRVSTSSVCSRLRTGRGTNLRSFSMLYRHSHRVRIANRIGRARHIDPSYHIAAALLPQPTRSEPNYGEGFPIARSEQYGVRDILFSETRIFDEASVDCRPATIEIENASSATGVEVQSRFAKVEQIWSKRDNNAATFRRNVREAYRSTCVVCGLRVPGCGPGGNPGVDAAHILPWANFDLDRITNGLCLCKMHHWAFDEGLIAIDRIEDEVHVLIPESAEDKATKVSPPMDWFGSTVSGCFVRSTVADHGTNTCSSIYERRSCRLATSVSVGLICSRRPARIVACSWAWAP